VTDGNLGVLLHSAPVTGAPLRGREVTEELRSMCVFSEKGVEIGGIPSVLSAYERLHPYR
jgi:hypothetical protein